MMKNAYYKTKIGVIKIGYDEKIREIALVDDFGPYNEKSDLSDFFASQIDKYLEGKLTKFDRLDLLDPIGTDFQKAVWKALLEIPYGKTISYKVIGEKIENPKAYQAIGSAVGKNPILVLIPCHRVIKSDGSLGGFAYGSDLKKKLLEIEGNIF